MYRNEQTKIAVVVGTSAAAAVVVVAADFHFSE